MDGLESFDDFLGRVRAAHLDQFPGAICSGAEFERMKRHILDQYQGVHVARSFLDPGGRPFDCIPFDEVPTVRAARASGHQVQTVPPPQGGSVHPTPTGPCPQGAVAWPRLTLEDLTRFGQLEDHFRKGMPPNLDSP